MNIYFDKENFVAYLRKVYRQDVLWGTDRNPNNSLLREIERLLREQCSLFFMFGKPKMERDSHSEEFQWLADSSDDNAIDNYVLFAQMNSDGIENPQKKCSFNAKIPDGPTNCSDIKMIMDYHNSILFLKKEFADKYSAFENRIIGNEENQIEKLALLMIDQKAVPSHMTYTPAMTNWSFMEKHTIPFKDIIIVDKFLFGTKKERYKYNIYDLIAKLNVHNQRPVNLVIFCCFEDTMKQIEEKKKSGKDVYNPNWKGIKKELSKRMPEKSKVTFIRPLADENVDLHDRYIITNYQMYVSGHSFSQYFNNKNGDKNKIVFSAKGGKWLSISTIAYSEIEKIVEKALVDLNGIIEKNCSKDYGCIIGDGFSNLLSINKEDIIDIAEYEIDKTTFHENREDLIRARKFSQSNKI